MTPREHQRARQRLWRIFEVLPAARQVLLSRESLRVKRRQLQAVFLEYLAGGDTGLQVRSSVEWVQVRDSARVWLNLLMPRNEELAHFNLVGYLDLLFRSEVSAADLAAWPVPTPGFLLEITHLLRGVTGTSRIYADTAPAFSKYEGRRAARLRSASLSQMARGACERMDAVPSGLDQGLVRRREENRRRILQHFGATEDQWDDWQWQVKHAIRDAETLAALVDLSDEERAAVEEAREEHIPFGITPYYASLMERHPNSDTDRAIRAQVIPSGRYVAAVEEAADDAEGDMDFMLERDTSPITGITRRYPMICILKPILACPQICVYCQRNWQIRDGAAAGNALPRRKLDAALQWIARTREIREVLVTGGDPLLLNDAHLGYILEQLVQMDHVERIRIGTRTPVTLPMRLTDELVQLLRRFHQPGRREILMVTHFEHPTEVTPAAMEAVQRVRQAGIAVYNQLVYTFYNSRRFEACALRRVLRLIGVTPYYTFNTKGKEETADFRVPIARLLQEQKEENRLLPGSVRTDEVVFNVPRLGKNYLRAGQHHDMVGILPDGRRVYEFHPWEKKLSLVDTYVYTDVSIHDYLQRLRKAGERTSDYKTIWYYY